MTGADHFAEAERHVAVAEDLGESSRYPQAEFRLGLAQLHATLALAAAVGAPPITTVVEPPAADQSWLDTDRERAR